MDERTKSAFGAATESVKQLLALGTASIGAAIALFDDGQKAGIDLGDGNCVPAGLGLLALSVVFGLFALGMLAGQLGNTTITTPTTYAGPVRFMAGGQLLFYGLGILALVVAAIS